MTDPTPASSENSFWLPRWARSIFFFTAVLVVAGIYLAFRIPISVFPQTNFPRVVIGVDNGVMPVEQMEVTITRPIEDAVNTVPGLVTVRSITSRGSAEVSLFFNWNVDMFQTLQLVNAAVARVQQTLPSTAQITTNRLTFATLDPILGYALTSDLPSRKPASGNSLRTNSSPPSIAFPASPPSPFRAARSPNSTSSPTPRSSSPPRSPSPTSSTPSSRPISSSLPASTKPITS